MLMRQKKSAWPVKNFFFKFILCAPLSCPIAGQINEALGTPEKSSVRTDHTIRLLRTDHKSKSNLHLLLLLYY